MSKSLSASKKVMKNYLSELLTDTESVDGLPKQASLSPLPEKPLALESNKDNKKDSSLT